MKFDNSFLSAVTRFFACCVAVGILNWVGTAGVCAQENGELYGIEGTSLVTVNLSQQTIETVGDIGILVRGLTYDRSAQMLFGIDASTNQDLVGVDPRTGVGMHVGPIGFERIGAIAYDSTSDRLLGIAWPDLAESSILIEIDKSTGVGASVGATGFLGFSGLAFDPQNDSLLGVAQPIDDVGNELVGVNGTTGLGVSLGTVNFNGRSSGLAFDPSSDQLLVSLPGLIDPFGGSFLQAIATVDTETGATLSEVLFPANRSITSLAFAPNAIPEPTSSSFLILGFAATLLRRRRHPAGN